MTIHMIKPELKKIRQSITSCTLLEHLGSYDSDLGKIHVNESLICFITHEYQHNTINRKTPFSSVKISNIRLNERVIFLHTFDVGDNYISPHTDNRKNLPDMEDMDFHQ